MGRKYGRRKRGAVNAPLGHSGRQSRPLNPVVKRFEDDCTNRTVRQFRCCKLRFVLS